ncbi:MAG: PEP-CTERM sorting domain-containing protein [Sulfuricaulis sp.]
MKSMKVRAHHRHGVTRHISWTLLLSGSLLAGTPGIMPAAFGATITDGTYISEFYYDGGAAVGSYSTPGGFNYTNGTLSQTNTISDSASPFASATATASLASDLLSLSLSGSNNYTSGTAEKWDTLTFGNLPSGPSVTASTVLGTLNMSVNASGGVGSSTGFNTSSAWGLDLYNTALLAPSSGSDCGLVVGACSGLITQSANGVIQASGSLSSPFAAGTYNYSVPITVGDLASGQVAYIAEIAAQNGTVNAPLTIDPSITLSGLYSGVTVSSTSGFNYAAPVPLPGTVWLFGSGLVGLLWFTRRQVSQR